MLLRLLADDEASVGDAARRGPTQGTVLYTGNPGVRDTGPRRLVHRRPRHHRRQSGSVLDVGLSFASGRGVRLREGEGAAPNYATVAVEAVAVDAVQIDATSPDNGFVVLGTIAAPAWAATGFVAPGVVTHDVTAHDVVALYVSAPAVATFVSRAGGAEVGGVE